MGAPSEHPPARHPAFQPLRTARGFTPTGLIIVDQAKLTAFEERWERTWAERWVMHGAFYYPRGTVVEQAEGVTGNTGRNIRW